MKEDINIINFLSCYDEQVFSHAMKLREVLLANLPGIMEIIDVPAKNDRLLLWPKIYGAYMRYYSLQKRA